jgi:hypothetical protein
MGIRRRVLDFCSIPLPSNVMLSPPSAKQRLQSRHLSIRADKDRSRMHYVHGCERKEHRDRFKDVEVHFVERKWILVCVLPGRKFNEAEEDVVLSGG